MPSAGPDVGHYAGQVDNTGRQRVKTCHAGAPHTNLASLRTECRAPKRLNPGKKKTKSLRRGIGVGVKGVTRCNSCAIVTQ